MERSSNSFVQSQKKGVKLSKENSDKLYNSAQILANNNNHGHAIPLLILSAEEIIKSLALCLEVFLEHKSEVKKIIKDSSAKAIDSYLFNHLDKHKLAIAIIADLKAISPFVRLVAILPFEFTKKVTSFFLITQEESSQIESVVNHLSEFNGLKNRGFYVDYKNDDWLSPLTLNEIDFENCKKDVVVIREIFSNQVNALLKFSDEEWIMLINARE